jgi:superfamily II RNA helicase
MLLGGLKGEPIDEIDNSLAHQAIGRAGRRGLDKEGIVIYSGVNIDSILIPKYRQIVPNNPELIEELFTEETEDFKKFIRTGERVVHEVKVVVKSVGVKSNEVKVESNSSCNSSSVKCNAQLLEKINIIKEKLYKLQVDWLKLSDLLDFLDIVENNVSPTLDHIQLLKILEVSNTLEEIEGIALPV